MSVDAVGDFLTVIRNGLQVRKRVVSVQHSKLKEQIANVLKNEGFIKDFSIEKEDQKARMIVLLKYVDGESVIHSIERVSKLGRRHYESCSHLKSVIGGLGIAVLTTSKGVMTDRHAKSLRIGGEVICHVW